MITPSPSYLMSLNLFKYFDGYIHVKSDDCSKTLLLISALIMLKWKYGVRPIVDSETDNLLGETFE